MGELLKQNTPLFWSKQRQVLHNFGSQILWGGLFSFLEQKSASKALETCYFSKSFGGGLFSFLEQKLASKALETCYFACFSGQWGRLEPPRPSPWLRYRSIVDNSYILTYSTYIFCLFVNSEQTHYFKIGKFCLFMMSRSKLNVKWQVTQTGGQSGLQLSSF